MFIIIVTHGEAQNVKPAYIFRSLTDNGRLQVFSAAKQLRQIIQSLVPALADRQITIGCVISSPAARCIETAIVFASELKDYTSTTFLTTESQLGEKSDGRGLNSDDVVGVLKGIDQEVVLLSVHGDFAGALPRTIQILPNQIDTQENGSWFKNRPVLIVVEYEPAKGWDNSAVLACQAYGSSLWESILI